MRPLPLAALLLGLAAHQGAVGGAAAAAVRDVSIVGTALEVTLADGRVLAGDGLVGAVLDAADGEGRGLAIRVDGFRADPLDRTGETVLYRLSTPDPAGGGWVDLCGPGPDGEREGFPLAEAGAEPGTFAITCTSGAVGKCVRLGYRPWAAGPDGRPLRDLHQACVRALRADYCGDGAAHTRDGTLVDLADRLGVQRSEPLPGMTLEAAFGPEGATCVRRTRLADVLALDELVASCPRLVGRVGEAACDEDAAGPLLVRSFGP